MNDERERILEMVAAGRIGPAEAEQLLSALQRPRRSPWAWCVQPLERMQIRHALVVSTVVAMGGLILSRAGIRFDGALDAHVVAAPVGLGVALFDQLLAWPVTAAIIWLVARPLARQGRYVDLLAAVGLARLPLLVLGALAALVDVPAGEVPTAPTPGLLILAFGSLPLLAWFFTLLVTGLRTATGLRGGRLALASILAIVLAEAATRALLWLI